MRYFPFILLLALTKPLAAQKDFRFYSLLYKTIYARDLCAFLQTHPGTVLIDVRSPGEFSDTSMYKNLNIEHLKNAIHMSPAEFGKKKQELAKYKNATVLVYGNRHAAAYCKELKEAGFANINLVYGGLWELVSTSANSYGFRQIRFYLENSEGLY